MEDGQDGDSADSATQPDLRIVEIVPDGDILLDVTFETSKETLKAARRAARSAARSRPGQQSAPPALEATTRVRYRTHLAVLKQNSKYFDNLLSDTRFAEARSIEARFQQLALKNVKPSEAEAAELPVVHIHEDDEATRSAEQAAVFEDLLRILHRKQSTNPKAVTMQYLAVLAVLADRFACTATVSRYLNALKYKWPATQTRLSRDDGPALSRSAEETLRQKILVSWLLDQPLKMHTATRELIMYGSRRWSASFDEDEEGTSAAWWDLPDDLERELQYRRECILATIASVQRHFLQLYTSRTRQCKLGYESSPSCDSYQLGEMVKFLCSRGLLVLSDFASHTGSHHHHHHNYPGTTTTAAAAAAAAADARDLAATTDIGHILATLKQCPAYQIDKHHTNCGLRTRLLPALEHIQAMLSSNVVSISRAAWARDRERVAWCRSLLLREEEEEEEEAGGRRHGAGGKTSGKGEKSDSRREKNGKEKKRAEAEEEEEQQSSARVFRFTRAVATDPRLRYEGALAVDAMARALFTATEWDWTPDEREDSRGVEFGRCRPADVLK
ncbi:uncharacterized protein THITE_2123159 [Thermothielavioides terrestris NRRL 8126]|uniref:BTB domain-containing protein n=1 Tax=Thermothielavioides terrestris (strain ATCC 38088 / NRRL 8126) TaxID=578455 RepID=G2RGX6_THETT|nr:uncharacterized protein THITE_2123159 [Thermothielavioides terrestris NRRL 8126]AEO71105.1 hypothetical protein THITE_2123159 [Thermothielavioides terrestris NRRL 8126]